MDLTSTCNALIMFDQPSPLMTPTLPQLCRRLAAELIDAVMYDASSKNIKLSTAHSEYAGSMRCRLETALCFKGTVTVATLDSIQYRHIQQIAKFAFLALSSATSYCLNSSVVPCLPSYLFCSQDAGLLVIPTCKTVYGSRAFCITARTVFDSFSLDIKSCDIVSSFCHL